MLKDSTIIKQYVIIKLFIDFLIKFELQEKFERELKKADLIPSEWAMYSYLCEIVQINNPEMLLQDSFSWMGSEQGVNFWVHNSREWIKFVQNDSYVLNIINKQHIKEKIECVSIW